MGEMRQFRTFPLTPERGASSPKRDDLASGLGLAAP